MKPKAQRLHQIDDKTIKCINLYKKYDLLLKQAVLDNNYNDPKIVVISERFNKLKTYLDVYVLYKKDK